MRARLVADGLAYLDGARAPIRGGDPRSQRELADGYQRLGDVQGNTLQASLGDSAGAMTSYGKAVERYETILAA